MSQEMAEIYAEAMRHLALKARGVVRDLNPKGEMKYMRIRAKRHEVLVAFGERIIACSHSYLRYLHAGALVRRTIRCLRSRRVLDVGCIAVPYCATVLLTI